MLSFTGFPGVVSAFTRTLYSYVVALLRAPRMDLPGLQRGAEFLDNGTTCHRYECSKLPCWWCVCVPFLCVHCFVCWMFANAGHLIYQGLIYLEAVYNNAVGHVFADFLIKSQKGESLSGLALLAY